MTKPQQIELLIKICREHHGSIVGFTGDERIDSKLNNIRDYPHLFVLACLMDRQIKAEKAWAIPYLVCRDLCNGDFSFHPLTILSMDDILRYFKANSLHRFNKSMAKIFYKAVQRIKNEYGSDAGQIWAGENSSAEIIYRFLCFEGSGVKIASMATNLLHRIFGISYTDYSALDISPDIHIRRVMYRIGLIDDMDDSDLVIYRAKSISPEYPGLMDECFWDMGRECCHPSNPDCIKCKLQDVCSRHI